MRDLGHYGQIVADEQDRYTDTVLKVLHEIKDLRLDGDIQRCRGFIGDEQRRFAGQRHGYHRKLAHPAGKLVRIQRSPL